MFMDHEDYFKEIKDNIGKVRFEHCLRVAEKAQQLADMYEADSKKAKIAGIFHDCCKFKDEKILLEKASEYKSLEAYMWIGYRKVLHAKLGAIFARDKYGIKDEDILNAIYYHSTGRAGMTTLEKIVYLADITEAGRNYEGVDILRKLERESLDLAMQEALSQSLKRLVDNRAYIADDTFSAYNYYLYGW